MKQICLYGADGKLLARQACGGSHEAVLTVPGVSAGSVVLVQVTLQNGTTAVHKVMAGR